ncbi:MAG: LytTR family DNA-binding domain-containing protein [Marinifilaceae bacterium]|jgi:DNA-binding LytR/AlgR family response regulator|nr:LytTR family DNA-binding domain-containing protein [Marinifilaceae bacterium]
MYKVAIVDDEALIVESIGKYCSNNKLVDKIKKETIPERFLDDLDDSTYQDFNVFLLDIDMKIRGDELAKEIKEKYSGAIIFFISGFENRASVSFRNQDIFDVVDKPLSQQKIDSVFEKISNQSISLKLEDIKTGEKLTKHFNPFDMIAISTYYKGEKLKKNTIGIFLGNKIYCYRSSLVEFIKKHKLNEGPFVQISQSTYVNKEEISEYCKSKLKMKNGIEFPVSREFKQNII